MDRGIAENRQGGGEKKGEKNACIMSRERRPAEPYEERRIRSRLHDSPYPDNYHATGMSVRNRIQATESLLPAGGTSRGSYRVMFRHLGIARSRFNTLSVNDIFICLGNINFVLFVRLIGGCFSMSWPEKIAFHVLCPKHPISIYQLLFKKTFETSIVKLCVPFSHGRWYNRGEKY